MAYKVTVKDESKKFLTEFDQATPVALIAAAQVIINEIKKRLAGGYTSGNFTTGNVLNSVTRTEPMKSGMGGWSLEVGTDVEYALYWELGHNNVFSGNYERQPIWEPSFIEKQEASQAAFQRTIRRLMRQDS